MQPPDCPFLIAFADLAENLAGKQQKTLHNIVMGVCYVRPNALLPDGVDDLMLQNNCVALVLLWQVPCLLEPLG